MSNLETKELLETIDMLCVSTVEEKPLEEYGTYQEFSQEKLEKLGFGEAQIEEIQKGIQQKLAVCHYARTGYNWKQMREIRLGLLNHLDVSLYDNTLFTAEQMHEIRRGMADGLDVPVYARLVFSAKDMAAKRRELLSASYQEKPKGYARSITDEESSVRIRLSDDAMEAFVMVPPDIELSTAQLERILQRHDVLYGISEEKLEQALEKAARGKEVPVAQGIPAKQGKDGSYEYFFNALLPDEPAVNPDGTVDYSQVIVADKRKTGDKLAKYHPATKGQDGETVTGIRILGRQGCERKALEGQGFVRNVKTNVYTAARSGYVVLDEEAGNLNVWEIYVVEGDINRYNGNIRYNGIVHIKGSVHDMTSIEAAGNVVIDGYVEGASIKAGDNIILKRGINGGVLEAGGSIAGSFFENASIRAKDTVEGNYFLNCDVVTDKSVLVKGSKSRIMGGKMSAGYFVEAGSIINSGKTGTFVQAGDTRELEQRMSQVQEQLSKIQEELRQLAEGKEKITVMFGKDAAGENALFHKICMAISTEEMEERKCRAELQYLDRVNDRAKRAYIRVRRSIQAGVLVAVGGKAMKVEEDREGEVTFKKEGA